MSGMGCTEPSCHVLEVFGRHRGGDCVAGYDVELDSVGAEGGGSAACAEVFSC